jgi:integrating conjugative element protein (TIGR03761 family)
MFMSEATIQSIKPDGAIGKAPRKAGSGVIAGKKAKGGASASNQHDTGAIRVASGKTRSVKEPILPMMPESITRPVKAPFPTSPSSPFDDKYDIESERLSLADMVQADEADMDDIRFPRYAELMDREDALRQLKSKSRLRGYADKIVTDAEAQRFSRLGKLVAAEREVMLLHTRDSYRLFMGRERGEQGYGAVSGKRIAASLRAIWLLSGNDNPYADWALLQTSDRIHDLRANLEKCGEQRVATLDALRSRGLNYSILQSQSPAEVELGFQSPYGYMLAEMIVDIDYYARIIKTLVAKDKMTQKEGSTRLFHDAISPARGIFETMLPVQRMLQREEILPLSRSDWTGSNEFAKKRVQFAVECFGECPRDVFTGARVPRHSRRKGEPSAEELSFLKSVPLDGHVTDQRDAVATTGALL